MKTKVSMTGALAMILVSCGGSESKERGHDPKELSGAEATFPFLFYIKSNN